MAEFFAVWAFQFTFLVVVMGVLGATMRMLEMLFPKGEIPRDVMLRSLVMWPPYLAFAGLAAALAALIPTVPALSVAVPHPVAGIVLSIVFADFCEYWMHRAQHRFIWRFHSLHHAIRHLSAVTGINHGSEPFVRLLFMTLPLAMVHIEPMTFSLVVLAYGYGHGFFVHSASRVHLGPLRYVFADNRYHRIHHSTDPAHFDKNFSTGFPIWDVLFGTARFPKQGEWPETGLDDQPPAKSLGDYFKWSFRRSPPPSGTS